MTVPLPESRPTAADYFAFERSAEVKHEFDYGEILAMSGASSTHVRIASNVLARLHYRLLGKPCQPYNSDLRICLDPGNRYVYPDVSVLRGPLLFDEHDDRGETVMNPRVIVEVLSPSTEVYDRTRKFDAYRRVETLRQYVLVAQDRARIDVFSRTANHRWEIDVYDGLDQTARLDSIEVELPLEEVYAGVSFEADATSDGDAR